MAGLSGSPHALLPGNNTGTTEAMPHITFTSPEVAQIGLTEKVARNRFKAKDLLISLST